MNAPGNYLADLLADSNLTGARWQWVFAPYPQAAKVPADIRAMGLFSMAIE